MKTLVIGGTGTVGSQLVRGLLGRGEKVLVLTRSAPKSQGLPAGAVGVVGDLRDRSGLPGAFKGAEAVFLVTAWSEDETEQGLAAVEAAKAARVRRIVFLSIHKLEAGRHIPHFASKIPIEKAIKESGMEYTILRPNNFYQNDFWFKDAITKYGVYPQPIGGVGLNRVDVRDIAEAGVNALLQPGHNRATYPLVGPDVLTGVQTAAVYTRHLGREIRYAGDDLDAWFGQAKTMLPLKQAEDFRIMYDHFQKHGLLASKEDYTQQAKVLPHPPCSFEAFVAEIAPSWKGM
jgi:uncharacterized protein YbjT (DUF2867 family)